MDSKIAFLKRIVNFFKNYLLRYPSFVLAYAMAYPQKTYPNSARFYSEHELFDQIAKGKSIIRIGDGEIGLLHGRDIHYQPHEKELELGLRKIIKEYTLESPYILSIPVFVNYTNQELSKTDGKLSCWLPLKVEFRKMFNKDAAYADAHFFYYRNLMLRFFNEFLQDKHVVFVTNEDANAEIRKTTIPFASATYVDTPKENSFDKLHNIIATVDNVLSNLADKKVVLAISTGPTSKILAKHYAELGYQSFDIGFGLRYIYDEKDYSNVI
ncbi:MAG: GT-D fold domain-containing glycosyltransferase [Patescibacteria group bacterium]